MVSGLISYGSKWLSSRIFLSLLFSVWPFRLYGDRMPSVLWISPYSSSSSSLRRTGFARVAVTGGTVPVGLGIFVSFSFGVIVLVMLVRVFYLLINECS